MGLVCNQRLVNGLWIKVNFQSFIYSVLFIHVFKANVLEAKLWHTCVFMNRLLM